MLVSLLNNHPAVVCHGEVYGRFRSAVSLKHVGINPHQFKDDPSGSFSLLETLYITRRNQQTEAIGFKLFPFQNEYIFNKVLADKEIVKVILIRNFLYAFTSREISDITGEYLVLGEKQPTQVKIEFNYPAFSKYYNRVQAYFKDTLQYLHHSGQKYYVIFADELNDIREINKVYSILGLPPAEKPLKTSLKPQNPSSLKDRIRNFNDTEKQLTGTPFEAFLKGDEVPDKETWTNPEHFAPNNNPEEKEPAGQFGKFVIFSSKRSKSNLLVSLLNNHEEVLCHAECFDKTQVYFSRIKAGQLGLKDEHDLEARDRNPIGFLEKMYITPASGQTKAIGFKFFPEDQNKTAFEYLKQQQDIKKIILIRNFLYAYTSFKITSKTQQWTLKDGEEARQAKIDFEIDDFLKYARFMKAFYRQLINDVTVRGQDYLIVHAENLLDVDEMNRIYSFIGLKALNKPLYAFFKQQNPTDLRARVNNYDDMVAQLRSTEFAHLLEGDLVSQSDYSPATATPVSDANDIGRFAVISLARSKTQLFAAYLNNHPNVVAHGEIFKKKDFHFTKPVTWKSLGLGDSRLELIKKREEDPLRFLEKMYATPSGEGVKCIGFKIFPGQNNRLMEFLLKDKSIKKIVLIRNFLYSFLSLQAAMQTDKWTHTGQDKPTQIAIDYRHQKFMNYYHDAKAFYQTMLEHLSAGQHPYYIINAEQLEDKQEINRVFRFLGMPSYQGEFRTALVKQNPTKLRKRVKNYDQMVDEIKRAGLAFLVNDDKVPDEILQSLTQTFPQIDAVEWDKKIDAATRGEDLYEIPSRFIFPRIKASLRLIAGPDYVDCGKDDVLVFCLFKNGAAYLPEFISHYKKLGVKHIYFLDNGSADSSREIIMSNDQLSLFQCDLNFTVYERVMREYMVQTYGKNKWCLVADIDEFFDFPFSNLIPLKTLVRYLIQNEYTGLVAQMLDMFANRPLLSHDPDDSLERHQYFDTSTIARHNYFKTTGTKIPSNNIAFLKGGIRLKAFGLDDVYITKTPLFFCNNMIHFAHIHYLHYARLADISAVLKHFKFFGDFEQKNNNMIALNCHREFRVYADVLKEQPELNLHSETAKKWTSAETLLQDGFLEISGEYLSFIFGDLWYRLESEQNANRRAGLSDQISYLLKMAGSKATITPGHSAKRMQQRIADLKKRNANMHREIVRLEEERQSFRNSFSGKLFGLMDRVVSLFGFGKRK